MAENSKIAGYKQYMASRGVSGMNAFPPLWHLLWAGGLTVPPPPFLGFIPMALLAGGVFGPLFALCVWLMRFRGFEHLSGQQTVWLALGTGVAFGLAMATYYRYLARKHGLGSWAAFSPSRQRG